MTRRIVVAITGASGIIYGIRTLEILRGMEQVESHLIVSRGARLTLGYESSLAVSDLHDLADVVHSDNDLGASLSSGSFRTAGMLVAPCSVKTLSGIANSYSATLVTRAADVTLKERRPLVLLVRETPLHSGHLNLMLSVTTAGAIVMPPVPAFYVAPRSVDDLVDQTVGRALDLFEIDAGITRRWTGDRTPTDPGNPAS